MKGNNPVKMVQEMKMAGTRRRGRPIRRWRNNIKQNMDIFGLKEKDGYDRTRNPVEMHDTDPNPAN